MKLEITTSERAYLRSLAVKTETIFQIGKGGITEETVRQISNALEARELIKARVLETSGFTARQAADYLADATDSAAVQAVGNRFVLYRPSKKNRKIELGGTAKRGKGD